MTNSPSFTLRLPKEHKGDREAILAALQSRIDESPDSTPVTSAEVVACGGTVHLACGSFNPYCVVHVKRDGRPGTINGEHRLIWLPQKQKLVVKRHKPAPATLSA